MCLSILIQKHVKDIIKLENDGRGRTEASEKFYRIYKITNVKKNNLVSEGIFQIDVEQIKKEINDLKSISILSGGNNSYIIKIYN